MTIIYSQINAIHYKKLTNALAITSETCILPVLVLTVVPVRQQFNNNSYFVLYANFLSHNIFGS